MTKPLTYLTTDRMKLLQKLFLILAAGLFVLNTSAQQIPAIGISDERPNTYAFINATIFVDYATKIDNASLLISGDKIVAVGQNIAIPKGAIVEDLKGYIIYPSFIDLYTNYGLNQQQATGRGGQSYSPQREQFESSEKTALNWNEAIKSDYNAIDEFMPDSKLAKAYRSQGIGTVLSFKNDGIARGSSVMVSLVNGIVNKAVLNSKIAAHYSFDKGSSKQNYPESLMGAIALLRQTYLDAQWYCKLIEKPFADQSLVSWTELQSLPQIFEVNDKLSALRADKIGDEFNIQYIIKGNGDEYQRIDELKSTNASFIIPLNFPEIKNVTNSFEADMIPYANLKHWETAPANPYLLSQYQIPFALTTYGLKDAKLFLTQIRKAISFGLSEADALKALTYTPAKLVNMEKKVGSLEKGKVANFFVSSGNVFDQTTIIHENWVQGKKYLVTEIVKDNFVGKYQLQLPDKEFKLNIAEKAGRYSFSIVMEDTIKIKVDGKIEGNTIAFNFKENKKDRNQIRLSGWKVEDGFKGDAYLADGSSVKWNALMDGKEEVKPNPKKDPTKAYWSDITYPFGAYGNLSKPQQEVYVFKNATVWTNEEEGVLKNTDVLVKNGKIIKIGENITEKGAIEIDGTGKYLTSGVIDEHSHIAHSGGTNEGTHAVTSEVRIKDIIDPEDISIYRQLSGGVTAAQILHGSANPIGGQSAIIKLKWGVSSDELLVKDGAQFLKHALGENVKQSRTPAFMAVRYPQTRMGVEAIIRDAYTRAQDYQKEWNVYTNLPKKTKANTNPPRTDLRLQAILDVLEERSFITCHAYVQSETNMIMKLAEDFNIKAHTLIHNSEGYKIADKIVKHGAYASNLPDWWTYKFEVYQAIPYNSAMQVKQGVTVAIHSDNGELARRLNQEAAKTIKYGGLSEEEAWKTVTLNAAKILHLDHRMGSIKVGKDADLVLWNNNPLSMYAVVEKTMVEGVIYFDKDLEEQKINRMNEERNRLINKALGQNAKPKR